MILNRDAMNRAITWGHPITIFGIPLILMIGLVLITQFALFNTNSSQLSIGITIDFVLTIPLVYFLLIRNHSIPKITVVPIFVLGIVVASFILPKDQQEYLSLAKNWLLPVVELTVISILLWKVRKLIQQFKVVKNTTLDFYDAIKQAAKEILPQQVAPIFATEIAMIAYSIFKWKKPEVSTIHFTSYKDNGIIALLSIVMFLVIVETFVFHLLITGWSTTLAWVLSIVSVYTGFQILGHLKALIFRSTTIVEGTLYLRNGILGDVKVDIGNIKKVECTEVIIEDENNEVRNLSLLRDLEGHNIALYFSEPIVLEQAYGFSKKAKVLLLYVDDPKRFSETISSKIIV